MHQNEGQFSDTGLISPRVARTPEGFRFARDHALHIFGSDAIYTFIPKNACSTMRYSIALNNGYIRGERDFSWIHGNNRTLAVRDARVLLAPRYSFVILRCPFTRLVSVFFDKFLGATKFAVQFVQEFTPDKRLDDLCFQDFVLRICELESWQLNKHWRPQIDFLIYREYSRYFRLEKMASAIEMIKRDIGLPVFDARHLAKHDTDSKRNREDLVEPWLIPVSGLRAMANTLPSSRAMYSRTLCDKVSHYYREDLEIYSEKFGTDQLLFK